MHSNSTRSISSSAGVLVLATEIEPSAALVETVRTAATGGAPVLVVAPLVPTRLRHWTSDLAHAEAVARSRLLGLLDELDRAGVAAEGTIGDADPALAAADALATFDADQLIVASPQPGLVRRLQQLYDGPILELPAEPVPARLPRVAVEVLSGAAA